MLRFEARSRCQEPMSGCVRMACDSLLTTSLLQVVNSLLQVDCQNLLSPGVLQVVTSLQMASCNKPDFNSLVAT